MRDLIRVVPTQASRTCCAGWDGRSPTVREWSATVTWLDGALKPKPGMALLCKGDLRPWTVVHAYGITAHEARDSNAGWKVADFETPICAA
jgi:hypothetical protein